MNCARNSVVKLIAYEWDRCSHRSTEFKRERLSYDLLFARHNGNIRDSVTFLKPLVA